MKFLPVASLLINVWASKLYNKVQTVLSGGCGFGFIHILTSLT